MSIQRVSTLLQGAEVIFWDFDGVIKDSVAVKSDAFEQLFLPYGKEVARQVRHHHEAHGGVSRYEKMPLYLEWAGEPVTQDKIDEFCNRFSQLALQAVIDAPWVTGVREYLLANYTQQRFVLVTATPETEMRQILETLGISRCFLEVCGAPMPKSTAIRNALQNLKFPHGQTLVVGDSETDLNAAETNGVAFLLRRTSLNRALQERYTGPMFDDLSHE